MIDSLGGSDVGGQPDNADKSTLVEQIYQQVLDAIVGGELAEGAELNQVTLAKKFGVSRIPVREALQRLHAERLLNAQPFHRYTVRTLSAPELNELVEIRLLLECFALRKFGGELDHAELEQLRELNDSLRSETDPQRWLEGDWELHRRLAGGDSASAEFAGDIRRRINRYLNTAGRLGNRHTLAVEDHEIILSALMEGDLTAAEARLRDHIEATGRALSELVARQADPTLE
ncbi:MAG: GntR family transcriptional regulator [Actinomycetota bacterium]